MGNILETFKPDMHAQNQAAQALMQGINKQSENNNNTLNAMLAIFENSRRDAREREKNDIEYNKNLNDSWQQGAFQKMLVLKDEKNPDGTPKYTDKQVMELLDKDKQAYIESQGGYRSGKHADLAETIAGGVAAGAKKLWDMGKGLFTKNEQDSQASAQNAESSAPQDSTQNAQNALTSGIQGQATQGSPLSHLEKESMASQVQSALSQSAQNKAQELNRSVSETLAMANPSQPQSISEGKPYQHLDTSSLKNTNAKN